MPGRAENDPVLEFARRAAEVLGRHYGERLVAVCLFGSAARGALRRGSDIDLLVVLEDAPRSYHKRLKELWPAVEEIRDSREMERLDEVDLHLEPSFLVLTRAEVAGHPPLLIPIVEEGVILADRDGFLAAELAGVRERLACLGAVKKATPLGPYWVLKPDLRPGEVFEI
ncbi:MAG: nucleotidyltransferase domain-containing protein [Desulfotomaculales bacterium]